MRPLAQTPLGVPRDYIIKDQTRAQFYIMLARVLATFGIWKTQTYVKYPFRPKAISTY